jgi:hypothetical protein
MLQLADVYIKLESMSFANMGSLDQPGADHIGPFARESLTEYINSQMIPLRLYNDLRDYLHASIELVLRLIMNRERYMGCEIDAFLVHHFLLDCISEILEHHRYDNR